MVSVIALIAEEKGVVILFGLAALASLGIDYNSAFYIFSGDVFLLLGFAAEDERRRVFDLLLFRRDVHWMIITG